MHLDEYLVSNCFMESPKHIATKMIFEMTEMLFLNISLGVNNSISHDDCLFHTNIIVLQVSTVLQQTFHSYLQFNYVTIFSIFLWEILQQIL